MITNDEWRPDEEEEKSELQKLAEHNIEGAIKIVFMNSEVLRKAHGVDLSNFIADQLEKKSAFYREMPLEGIKQELQFEIFKANVNEVLKDRL